MNEREVGPRRRLGLEEFETAAGTQLAMVENDRANEIKMQALSILHEEAMKSFSRGSKAAADFVEAYSKRVSKH